jgi:hypothetical protein
MILQDLLLIVKKFTKNIKMLYFKNKGDFCFKYINLL